MNIIIRQFSITHIVQTTTYTCINLYISEKLVLPIYGLLLVMPLARRGLRVRILGMCTALGCLSIILYLVHPYMRDIPNGKDCIFSTYLYVLLPLEPGLVEFVFY